jgi:drug/metabolite transporter (DMT)-like permease
MMEPEVLSPRMALLRRSAHMVTLAGAVAALLAAAVFAVHASTQRTGSSRAPLYYGAITMLATGLTHVGAATLIRDGECRTPGRLIGMSASGLVLIALAVWCLFFW